MSALALLRRVDEYVRFETAIDRYVEYTAKELCRTFPDFEARNQIVETLGAARPLTGAGQAARSIFVEHLAMRAARRSPA